MTSFNILSSASIECLCDIDASSHIIIFVYLKRSLTSSLYSMLQVELSSVNTSILNLECAVLPQEITKKLYHWWQRLNISHVWTSKLPPVFSTYKSYQYRRTHEGRRHHHFVTGQPPLFFHICHFVHLRNSL